MTRQPVGQLFPRLESANPTGFIAAAAAWYVGFYRRIYHLRYNLASRVETEYAKFMPEVVDPNSRFNMFLQSRFWLRYFRLLQAAEADAEQLISGLRRIGFTVEPFSVLKNDSIAPQYNETTGELGWFRVSTVLYTDIPTEPVFTRLITDHLLSIQ